MNYTLGKGMATQGGDLASYYLAAIGNTQDFWDPEFDRGPSDNDIRHRVNGSFIYEVPGLQGDRGLLNAVLGGWQISAILSTVAIRRAVAPRTRFDSREHFRCRARIPSLEAGMLPRLAKQRAYLRTVQLGQFFHGDMTHRLAGSLQDSGRIHQVGATRKPEGDVSGEDRRCCRCRRR